MHTYIHTYVYTYMYAYIHICIHTYMYTYMYTYIHIYIHAYMSVVLTERICVTGSCLLPSDLRMVEQSVVQIGLSLSLSLCL